jgi:hypothetical protein
LPKNNAPRIEAWSYSRYSDYAKCPALAKFKHVEKRKEPENQYSERGNQVHTMSQQFTEGILKKLPKELQGHRQGFDMLRKVQALCEQEWAFNKEWQKTGWFDRDAWLRIKMDAHYLQSETRMVKRTKVNEDVVVVIDVKSGRIYEDHEKQRSLYALGALLVYPTATKVITKHWYLDQPAGQNEAITEFNGDQLPVLQREWMARVKPMLNDTWFAPRPGNYCRFCFFRKSNGGPCQY